MEIINTVLPHVREVREIEKKNVRAKCKSLDLYHIIT